MAYGRKYFYEFSSDPYPALGVDSERFRVSFFWKDFSGVATQLKTTRSSTRLSYTDNSDSITTPIRAKLLTMQLVAEGDIDLDEFYADSDRDCYVTIDKWVTGTTYTAPEFTGWLSAFDGKEPFICKPYTFELKAYCGLASLKDFTFSATGKITFNEAIRLCLLNTGFALNYVTAIETRISGSIGDPTKIYSFYADRLNGLDCYEALTEILKAFVADVEQQGNVWLLRGVSELAAATTKLYTYDSTGEWLSANVPTDYSRSVGRIRNNRNIRGAMTRSNPALSYVEISYELGPTRNLLSNGSFTDSTTVSSTIFFADWTRNNLTNLDIEKLNPGIKIKGRGEMVALSSIADLANPLGPLLNDSKYFQHEPITISGAEQIVFKGEFTPFELDYAKFEVWLVDPANPSFPVWLSQDGTWKESREIMLIDYKAAVVRSFGDLPPAPASYPFEIKSSGTIPNRRAPATSGTRPYVDIRYSQLMVRIYRGAYNNQTVQVTSPTGPYIVYNNLYVSFTAKDENNLKLVYGFKNNKYVRKNALKMSTAFGGFSVQLSEIVSRKREAYLNSYASVILKTDGTEIVDEWVKPGTATVYDFVRLGGISRLMLNASASKIWEGDIVGAGIKSSDIVVFDDLSGRFKPTSWVYDYVSRITSLTLHQLLSASFDFTETLEEGTTGSNSSGGKSSVSTIGNNSSTVPVVTNPVYDSSVLSSVGGIDPVSGLVQAPTFTTDSKGLVITKDHIPVNVWFKVRGQVQNLKDILTLFPTNTLSSLPLIAQNGVAAWWKAQVETLVNAPTGLTGYADIEIKTLGKRCEVTVINGGGKSYNYTVDLTAGTVVWSGWKFVPFMSKLAEIGKLFKAVGGQEIGQSNIYDYEDGTFSVGEMIRFAGAVFSVVGRVGVGDALFPDDAVNLRTAQALLSNYVSSGAFQLIYNNILNLLAQTANRVHSHEIADINRLAGELDSKVNKQLFLNAKPYWVAGRNSIGDPVMIDNKGAALNGQYLPDAIEGVPYDQTLARSLFVYPDGVYQIDLVRMSDKAWVRNGLTWDYVSGLRLNATPTDSENPHIAVKLRWKFAENDEWKEQEFTVFLNVEPSGTVITSPTAPSGLTATAEGTNVINLAWTDNSSNEAGFKIYRRIEGGTLALIATVAAGVTAYRNTNLNSETRYYYKVEAFNVSGATLSNEADAVTGTVPDVGGYIDEPVAGTSRIRALGTITPPVVVPPVTGTDKARPVGQKFGFQFASYVQTNEVVWQHKTTGEKKVFGQFDQNNNPNREKPDGNWFVAEVTETETFIKRTADAGCNLADIWFRTPLLQTSAQTYHFEIIGRLLDYAAAQKVYLSLGFRQDIGNGGHPDRIGFGHDQSAPWRFTLAQCEKSQRFGDEGGTTETFYPAELSPCYQHLAVQDNIVTFYTALFGYLQTHPNKAWISSIHPIYSDTGEAHFNINSQRYMGACITTMQNFRTWLLGKPTAIRTMFSDFIANWNSESNSDARAFLRGYVSDDMKAVWQWFLQAEYFVGYSGNVNNGVYGRLGTLARQYGFKLKRDDGSFTDFSTHRGNMLALAPNFIAPFDVVKHNPAGQRVGYTEAAALKATGKTICLEWTPGAIGSGEDFSDTATAISTITAACKDAWDAGVDEQILSFVIDNDYYNTVAIPIIQNLIDAGYWTLPKQTFTPSTVFDVSLRDQITVGGWYANDSDGTAEPNEPMHRMATAVNADGKTRANIQKYGFRILTVNDPTQV